MSILVNKNTKVICQGITGSAGAFHTKGCLDYGTKMVGGVTPGKGGQKDPNGLPIFDTVSQAVKGTGADATMIFVPPPFAADAIMEAADAGIKTIVAITEGIPVLDMVKVKAYLKDKPQSVLVGPNGPGVITPGECKIGIMPGYIHLPAKDPKSRKTVGIISRSGTLTYEAVWQCATRGIGQTTAVGIGGDPVKGLNFIELLEMFNKDPETQSIIMIGEIGGSDEADAARYVKQNVKKPVVGFIAGRTAPAGKRMGHAGAIISGGDDTADAKLKTFKECGVHVSESPATIGETLARVLGVPGVSSHVLHYVARDPHAPRRSRLAFFSGVAGMANNPLMHRLIFGNVHDQYWLFAIAPAVTMIVAAVALIRIPGAGKPRGGANWAWSGYFLSLLWIWLCILATALVRLTG